MKRSAICAIDVMAAYQPSKLDVPVRCRYSAPNTNDESDITMGRRKSPQPDPALVEQMRREGAQRDIETLRRKLHLDGSCRYTHQLSLLNRVAWMDNLAVAYRTVGDLENMRSCCRQVIRWVHLEPEKFRVLCEKERRILATHFRNAHYLLAPDSFIHFLICMECNFAPEMQFYSNRKMVLEDWAKQMEQLEFGELDILGLSAPPRTGKSGLETLFMLWVAGRHPEKSILFATHTNAMAVKMQQDFYSMATDPKRGYDKVFPGLQIEKSAEYLWLDFQPKQCPNNYKTVYFRGIDGNMAGVLEASHLIVVDDLIKNIEEALNPTRLDNAWQKYSTDISQRRTDNSVKELHIATRWSIHDVLTRLEEENEGNPRAKFIKVPGLNEKGKSNFNFPYRPMTTEHFEKLRNRMDEVSFECIIQQNPIERDGLVFTRDSLSYYEGELPEGNPDEVVFAADIAFGGGDFLSMPVAYVYGFDAYIHDVVHSDKTKETTRPVVAECIRRNGCQRGYMEANNGGSEYAEKIDTMLRELGYRCHIESRRAPTNKAKLTRILDAQSEIKALITDGSGYRLHFLSPAARRNKPMYEAYMKHLCNFNQSAKFVGKQKDDAADATSMLVSEVLNRKNISGTVSFMSRRALAL